MKAQVDNLVTTRLPTKHGEFSLQYYRNTIDDKEHVALVKGRVADQENVLVRIHSECFTCDVFGSRLCDCAEQLERALQRIDQVGCGVLIYLRQEGRGLGLLKKLQAYNLQDQGKDSAFANRRLGHGADERDYTIATLILKNLNIKSIALMTENPRKKAAFKDWAFRELDDQPLRNKATVG